MADTQHFDFVVIGTGPGGEGAAMRAAKGGKTVAAVERFCQVGGGCTHWATIPSKALRQAIYHINLCNQSSVCKRIDAQPKFSFPELLATANAVIAKQVDAARGILRPQRRDAGRPATQGSSIRTRSTVDSPDSVDKRITADAFVIATGSRPFRPADVDFTHPRIFDSDTLLTLDRTPPSITDLRRRRGGLRIRLDVAQHAGARAADQHARQAAGVSRRRDHRRARATTCRKTACASCTSEEYERVEPTDGGVIVHLKSGKKIRSDILLWANGRTGNTDDLGLENDRHHAQSPRPDRGQRALSDRACRTSTPWVTWSAIRRWPAPPTIRDASPPATSAATRTIAWCRTFPPASTPARKSPRSARPNGS